MHIRTLVPIIVALGLVVLPQGAIAKDLQPGDVLVCDATTCVPIMDQRIVDAFERMYYGTPAPVRVHAPKTGKPYVFLRFSSQYITGIVATDHLDRFLTYGVNMSQFGADRW